MNLLLNIIFVNLFGITGVVAATVLSIAVLSIPFETYYVYKFCFDMSPIRDLIKELGYFIVTVIVVAITFFVSR